MNRATWRQLAGIALVAAVATAAALATSPAALYARAAALTAHPLLFGLALLGLYLVRPLLAWPISALSVVLGYLLGPVAIPIALAGAVVTTLPAYALARHVGHDAGFLGRIGDAGFRARAAAGDLRGVAAVRLVPLPTDPVSYAIGLARVPLRPYLLGTALGEAPWVVAAVLLGASANELARAGSLAATDPALLLATVALAVVLVLAGPAYRRLAANRPGTQ